MLVCARKCINRKNVLHSWGRPEHAGGVYSDLRLASGESIRIFTPCALPCWKPRLRFSDWNASFLEDIRIRQCFVGRWVSHPSFPFYKAIFCHCLKIGRSYRTRKFPVNVTSAEKGGASHPEMLRAQNNARNKKDLCSLISYTNEPGKPYRAMMENSKVIHSILSQQA
jgi:hypothetical protein